MLLLQGKRKKLKEKTMKKVYIAIRFFMVVFLGLWVGIAYVLLKMVFVAIKGE